MQSFLRLTRPTVNDNKSPLTYPCTAVNVGKFLDTNAGGILAQVCQRTANIVANGGFMSTHIKVFGHGTAFLRAVAATTVRVGRGNFVSQMFQHVEELQFFPGQIDRQMRMDASMPNVRKFVFACHELLHWTALSNVTRLVGGPQLEILHFEGLSDEHFPFFSNLLHLSPNINTLAVEFEEPCDASFHFNNLPLLDHLVKVKINSGDLKYWSNNVFWEHYILQGMHAKRVSIHCTDLVTTGTCIAFNDEALSRIRTLKLRLIPMAVEHVPQLFERVVQNRAAMSLQYFDFQVFLNVSDEDYCLYDLVNDDLYDTLSAIIAATDLSVLKLHWTADYAYFVRNRSFWLMRSFDKIFLGNKLFCANGICFKKVEAVAMVKSWENTHYVDNVVRNARAFFDPYTNQCLMVHKDYLLSFTFKFLDTTGGSRKSVGSLKLGPCFGF